MAEHNKIIDVFHALTLEKLVTNQKLITVKSTDGIETVVKTLAQNRIHAVPVLEGGVCLGFVDTLDIIHHVLKVAPEPEKIQAEELKSLEMAGRAMSLEEVKYILNASGRDPYVPFQVGSPASAAIPYLAGGAHRILLLDHANNPVYTVSQTDFVHHLAHVTLEGKLKRVGLLEQKLSALGLGLVTPIVINQQHTVLRAFQLLNFSNISAAAVTNDEGQVVANFSASDLVGLYTEQWPHFKWTVKEYLEKYSPKSIGNVVSLSPEDTLADLLKTFKEHKVHQVWLLKDGKPTGVITQTDILRFIRDSQ